MSKNIGKIVEVKIKVVGVASSGDRCEGCALSRNGICLSPSICTPLSGVIYKLQDVEPFL